MRRILAALAIVALLRPAALVAAAPQVAHGKGGAVAAAEENAAKAGIEILKKGGNAADAAVAVAFALAVTWPEAGNIGGGGFWISRDATGKTIAVDFREVAPRAARRERRFLPGTSGARAGGGPEARRRAHHARRSRDLLGEDPSPASVPLRRRRSRHRSDARGRPGARGDGTARRRSRARQVQGARSGVGPSARGNRKEGLSGPESVPRGPILPRRPREVFHRPVAPE